MSLWPTTLYVDKRQPVFSSALIAWGLAHLVYDILEQLGMQTRVTLSDQGSYFCIVIPSHFALSEAAYIRLLRQIRTAKHYEGLANDAFDYEEFRLRERDYFAALESLRKEGTSLAKLPESSERRRQIEGLRPRPEWQIITMINQMGALS